MVRRVLESLGAGLCVWALMTACSGGDAGPKAASAGGAAGAGGSATTSTTAGGGGGVPTSATPTTVEVACEGDTFRWARLKVPGATAAELAASYVVILPNPMSDHGPGFVIDFPAVGDGVAEYMCGADAKSLTFVKR